MLEEDRLLAIAQSFGAKITHGESGIFIGGEEKSLDELCDLVFMYLYGTVSQNFTYEQSFTQDQKRRETKEIAITTKKQIEALVFAC